MFQYQFINLSFLRLKKNDLNTNAADVLLHKNVTPKNAIKIFEKNLWIQNSKRY